MPSWLSGRDQLRGAIVPCLSSPPPQRGRGAPANPPNRFEPLWYSRDPEWNDLEDPALETQFFKDTSRSIITYNDSPDVGFDASINPYRGCEHGCIYCYARPTHEYLGFSAGLDFESKILVKEDAPELLRRELSSPRWKPQVLAISGVTDSYQPIERRLQLTRRCLQVLAEFRNPVVIITKNHLVTRDVDVLGELAQYEAARVFLSVTTLDGSLSRVMEPRASHPHTATRSHRDVITGGCADRSAGGAGDPRVNRPRIAVDHRCRGAGWSQRRWLCHAAPAARCGTALRAVADASIFLIAKIKCCTEFAPFVAVKLNDPRFSSRMRGEGIFAEQIRSLFALACRKAGIDGRGPALSTAAFRVPSNRQLPLFE